MQKTSIFYFYKNSLCLNSTWVNEKSKNVDNLSANVTCLRNSRWCFNSKQKGGSLFRSIFLIFWWMAINGLNDEVELIDEWCCYYILITRSIVLITLLTVFECSSRTWEVFLLRTFYVWFLASRVYKLLSILHLNYLQKVSSTYACTASVIFVADQPSYKLWFSFRETRLRLVSPLFQKG